MKEGSVDGEQKVNSITSGRITSGDEWISVWLILQPWQETQSVADPLWPTFIVELVPDWSQSNWNTIGLNHTSFYFQYFLLPILSWLDQGTKIKLKKTNLSGDLNTCLPDWQDSVLAGALPWLPVVGILT